MSGKHRAAGALQDDAVQFGCGAQHLAVNLEHKFALASGEVGAHEDGLAVGVTKGQDVIAVRDVDQPGARFDQAGHVLVDVVLEAVRHFARLAVPGLTLTLATVSHTVQLQRACLLFAHSNIVRRIERGPAARSALYQVQSAHVLETAALSQAVEVKGGANVRLAAFSRLSPYCFIEIERFWHNSLVEARHSFQRCFPTIEN